MEPSEFRQFVIKCAEEIIFEGMNLEEKEKILKQPEPPKLTKPSFTKKDVNKLPKIAKAPKTPQAASIATPPKPKEVKEESIQESVSPEKIKFLAEEMKKINKKIDLRNPLINPELFDIISEEKKVVEKDKEERWKNLYNYEIPKDDLR